jgi:dCMP deaminase
MRKSWDQYFMDIAQQVSARSTCDRKHVGCVLVQDRRIISTGYNGSIPGQPHCDDVGHDMDNGHCVRTVHSEINAITQAAKAGIPTQGAHAFVNTYPCWDCFKVMLTAGITKIIYDADYRPNPRVEAAAKLANIDLLKLTSDLTLPAPIETAADLKKAIELTRVKEPVPPSKACLRCGAYTTTLYCSFQCANAIHDKGR